MVLAAPRLSREAADTDDLFTLTSDERWFVLHTKSRQEKRLNGDLQALGLKSLLPCVNRTRFHGRRKVVVEEPLFPGYVFLRGLAEDAYVADRTKRVASLIKVNDQSRLNWELENITRAIEASGGVPIDMYPHLKVGLRAEIDSGPFRGVQGLILSRSEQNRLMLQVDMLGQCVALDVDGATLSIIE